MVKNYYAILGVLPTATVDEIRSAYRSRVKEYHPDHFGEDSEPFLIVQEAYEVLGNPNSRRSYDRNLHEAGIRKSSTASSIPVDIHPRNPSMDPFRAPRRPVDMGTIFARSSFNRFFPSFEEIFDSLWNILEQPSGEKSERFRTLTMEVLLTQDQARRGGHVQIQIPIQHPCPACAGLGDSGRVGCWRCDGSGSIRNELSLQVEYPPGIQDSYRVAVPLNRYGIPDICPVLHFRISGNSDMEEIF